ncbi:MAG TPA: DUF2007 domain-containing protein [Ferruginibacter sp.]|nr:DUF2007 domain-containing protein [Ferruginibacter sp.]HRE62233.1 DUF2007 domain-containing protein [Ferruginibacter sp.]
MSIQFIQIASFDNYLLANMTLGLLQDNYINCHLKDEHIVTIDPLLNPAVGGIKLMVAQEHVPRAEALISEAEKEYLSQKKCPQCLQTGLVAEEKISRPTSVFGKIKNILAYGQETIYSKKYRCVSCNALLDTLNLDEEDKN